MPKLTKLFTIWGFPKLAINGFMRMFK